MLNKEDSINIITLGCSKNLVDSENLMTQLKSSGYNASCDDPQLKANIIVINTCGFIEASKKQSVQEIVNWGEAKKKGLIEKLYVTGCLSQRYRESLMTEMPFVDGFFGARDIRPILEKFSINYKENLLGERQTTTPNHYSYIKVAEGCDRFCQFCAIPLIRGRQRSRTIEEIVKEVRHLVAKGTKEIMLIAQDLTLYGRDLNGKRQLAHLVESLTKIAGLSWIRLHYAFPTGFPMEVIELMAKCDNVCHYLDMPLQHVSENILSRMSRPGNAEKLTRLIANIRKIVPDIALRTTFLTGFPGEQNRDFRELLHFVKEIEFDRVGVFTYSHEDNTPAMQYQDDVPKAVKNERRNEIMKLQKSISLKKNKAKIGQKMKLILDRKENNTFIARTYADSPEVDNQVVISHPLNDWQVGDLIQLKIKDAGPYDLYTDCKS